MRAPWEDSEIRNIADKYSVSREVVLRRLLTLGRMQRKHFIGRNARSFLIRTSRKPGAAKEVLRPITS